MGVPQIVPVLVNRREHDADALLRDIGRSNGDRLLVKVRLADVVDPAGWMDTRPTLGTFALKSHFDFVMVDNESSMPRFAVEIDGNAHRRDTAQRSRDKMKDELCREAGLPLLRINSDFGRREGKYVLLNYVCNAFYLAEGFEAAQQAGTIPLDEPFDHGSFLDVDDATGQIHFASIDARARAELRELYEAGSMSHWFPDLWVGKVDEWGDIRCDAYLNASKEFVLVDSSQVRNFGFFGIAAPELAEELAVLELRKAVDGWLRNEPVALSRAQFKARFRSFVKEHEPMNYSSVGDGSGTSPLPYPEYKITPFPTYAAWVAND